MISFGEKRGGLLENWTPFCQLQLALLSEGGLFGIGGFSTE